MFNQSECFFEQKKSKLTERIFVLYVQFQKVLILVTVVLYNVDIVSCLLYLLARYVLTKLLMSFILVLSYTKYIPHISYSCVTSARLMVHHG